MMAIGIVYIFSTGISATMGRVDYLFVKQIIWVFIGLILCLLFSTINYGSLERVAIPVYAISLAIVLLTAFFGTTRNGASAWLGISLFGLDLGIQPSEFSKIAFILFLSVFLNKRTENISSISTFFIVLFLSMIPVFLVILQSDIGTALVFIPVFLIMLYVAGGNIKCITIFVYFSAAFTIFVAIIVWAPYSEGILWQISRLLTESNTFILFLSALLLLLIMAIVLYRASKNRFFLSAFLIISTLALSVTAAKGVEANMKPYMKDRILAYINPSEVRLDAGWHVIQSRRAIGSGGAWGKGFLKGTLAHFEFLPNESQPTDFIFSVIGEEAGFGGCLAVLIAAFFFISRLLSIAKKTENKAGGYFCTGFAALFFIHLIENIGMTMALLPVTGIPLLLVSYGGSAILAASIGIGIALSINKEIL